MRHLRALTIAICTLLSAAPDASATSRCDAVAPFRAIGQAPVNDRIRHHDLEFEGASYGFTVLIPPGYDNVDDARRYPVLYLLHGAVGDENIWFYEGGVFPQRVAELASSGPPERHVIIVAPDGGGAAFYADSRDGARRWETFHARELIRWIDANYRTIPDRAHRAIAGYSGGGRAAMVYAARHPDLYAVAGSFSGVVDMFADGVDKWFLSWWWPASSAACDGTDPTRSTPWTDPVTDEIAMRNRNAVDLAPNLHAVRSFVSAGNGVPCDGEEAPYTLAFLAWMEPFMRDMASNFDRALGAAAVAHETRLYECGVHYFFTYMRGLRDFWPGMLQAFDRPSPPPNAFDYRSADPQFDVWGWRFEADPARASEFMDIMDASGSGVTLTGSGLVTVTTASMFSPHQRVRLRGATSGFATANTDGRITFRVDLGAAHRVKQYSIEQRMRDAPDYFMSRTVLFRRG